MSEFTPIIPTYQKRDLANLELQKLLNRLFQELDDQNSGLDEIEKVLSEIALRSNVDYKRWTQKNTTVSVKDGVIEWDKTKDPNEKDLLQELLEKRKNGALDTQDERTLLSILIDRENKLSKHYEAIIDSYQELLQNIAIAARKRREETFGVYRDEPVREGAAPMQPLETIIIDSKLKKRIQPLKRNAELLNSSAVNKSVELKLTKNTLLEEAEKLNKELE